MTELKVNNIHDIHKYCKDYVGDNFTVLELIEAISVKENKNFWLFDSITDEDLEKVRNNIELNIFKVISKIFPNLNFNFINVEVTRSNDFGSLDVNFNIKGDEKYRKKIADIFYKEYTISSLMRLERKRKLKRIKSGR